jgi:hypothetical protein
MLGLHREGDADIVHALESRLSAAQAPDGSFEQSLMNTAGTLNLLNDLKVTGPEKLIAAGASYLISILESQSGYDRARDVKPGSIRTPCDLFGFFGPYEDRSQPEVLERGAREMNFYREYEPLIGPKSPVRSVRRSSLDRVGPGSCYSWGLIPLCYIIESLCRAGYAHDERVQPAVNALLGAQWDSGGWCRNPGGGSVCTIHAVRTLGSHPELKSSTYAERMLKFMRSSGWRGVNVYGGIQAIAAFELPIAREIIRGKLPDILSRQRQNGTFGSPCKIERVTAVLIALRRQR